MAGMKQGDLYLVNLDPTLHTEIGKTRPALIVSIDEMNAHLPRVLVAPISSNVQRIYLHEVFIPAGSGGLAKDSKIMVDQLRSIDKRRLIKKIGQVNREVLRNACNAAIELISPP
jgi:mRNA interferase MazF